MRRGIVAGNWKMHGSMQFVTDYVQALAQLRVADGDQTSTRNTTTIVFPPLAYLGQLCTQLADCGLDQDIETGAQDLHTEVQGAFTGETSGEMIRDLGAKWVLVGHSERRQQAAVTDEQVAEKFAAALRADLKPILCVGETLEQREAGDAQVVVARQLAAVVGSVGSAAFSNAAIAYEPVWAIGTGATATPEIAQSMHSFLRQELLAIAPQLAQETPILYGGSVKASNAAALFCEQDIDGGLVGGASLDAAEFAQIAGFMS